ncbi:hypothetical protein [Tunicatimonas pelagia]|uniref:hypothetical protein n=1 Tax=Tunicatimonas pelagia TaxID=931531 RepID=UPI002665C0C2|nr:hypothetical protein [Tunicatimonas pelagia]WKN44198.1 hypothetical protein P0M28_04355 [Tunicatimonas pelagia]
MKITSVNTKLYQWQGSTKTDDSYHGISNAGMCPDVTQQIIDAKLAPLLTDENPLNTEYLFKKCTNLRP